MAVAFLGDFPGDIWQAYRQLPEATLVGCWAYVGRKFIEAMPPIAKGKSLLKQGICYCNKMFTLESSWGYYLMKNVIKDSKKN